MAAVESIRMRAKAGKWTAGARGGAPGWFTVLPACRGQVG